MPAKKATSIPPFLYAHGLSHLNKVLFSFPQIQAGLRLVQNAPGMPALSRIGGLWGCTWLSEESCCVRQLSIFFHGFPKHAFLNTLGPPLSHFGLPYSFPVVWALHHQLKWHGVPLSSLFSILSLWEAARIWQLACQTLKKKKMSFAFIWVHLKIFY